MRSGQVFTSLALVWAGSVRHAQRAYCSGTPDPNAPRNANPITDAVPAFIREVTNGKLYSVTQTGPNGTPGQTFAVTHVWGTPYEKGFAQGQLLQSEIQAFYNQTWAYLEEEISSSLPGLFFPDVRGVCRSLCRRRRRRRHHRLRCRRHCSPACTN